MHSSSTFSARTPGPPRKRMRQCVHVESNVTLHLQLSSVHAPRCSDVDDLHHTDSRHIPGLVHIGMQTTGSDEESTSKVQSELRQVKEQLRNVEDSIAYLSDRVKMYRGRWLEEYYRTNNLECHMPLGTLVPDLAQIAEGASSPHFSLDDLLEWDECEEQAKLEWNL
ncbi:hypothetical protein DFH29DRAFT_873974 [Suillus ampliporus]|nr:hypothetical protein DFH29DRAFT_873974 [Suillus ampliporus]